MAENVVSTPTRKRCVTSYAARTQYRPGVIRPPNIKVKDAIDIHCHAHEGQQSASDLAKHASRAEMKGILFKSILGDDPGVVAAPHERSASNFLKAHLFRRHA